MSLRPIPSVTAAAVALSALVTFGAAQRGALRTHRPGATYP